MEEYKREGITPNMDFKQYDFCKTEGSFSARYVARWMNKNQNLVCCFDFDDGRKIRAMVWQDNDYLGMDKIKLGAIVVLDFKASANSKNIYLRNVTEVS